MKRLKQPGTFCWLALRHSVIHSNGIIACDIWDAASREDDFGREMRVGRARVLPVLPALPLHEN